METPADFIEVNGHEVEVWIDECQDDFDPISRDYGFEFGFIGWHRRYNLGNEDLSQERFEEDVRPDCVVLLPWIMYEHGQIGFSTSRSGYPFDCPWDSGQLGWLYATREQIRKQYGVKKVQKKHIERAEEDIRRALEMYEHYVNGSIYGFTFKNPLTREVLDSCGGFLGWDHEKSGLVDCAKEAVRAYLESEEKAVHEGFRKYQLQGGV